MAHGAQPRSLLARREADIGFRPAARPVILVAVEARRTEPVLPGEVERILDAQPALLGAVDEKQAAERPEGLAAEALLGLLVEHDDAPAGVGDFAGGGEARQTRANDDRVGVERHAYLQVVCAILRDRVWVRAFV